MDAETRGSDQRHPAPRSTRSPPRESARSDGLSRGWLPDPEPVASGHFWGCPVRLGRIRPLKIGVARSHASRIDRSPPETHSPSAVTAGTSSPTPSPAARTRCESRQPSSAKSPGNSKPTRSRCDSRTEERRFRIEQRARRRRTTNEYRQRRVAPRSHGHAKRDDVRLSATRANPRHFAETRMSRPLLTFMVRRGSTVRVRQRASQKASKWRFLLPRPRTLHRLSSLSLSPRSVPNIAGALQSWLKQRRLASSSTSMKGRWSTQSSAAGQAFVKSRVRPSAAARALACATPRAGLETTSREQHCADPCLFTKLLEVRLNRK